VAVITFNGLDLIRIIVDEENKEKTRFSPFSRIIFNSSFSRNLWILYKIHPEENLSS
jgi:hypothetical protein